MVDILRDHIVQTCENSVLEHQSDREWHKHWHHLHFACRPRVTAKESMMLKMGDFTA